MSENEFNNNPNEEQNSWNGSAETPEPEIKPEEPVLDTAAQETENQEEPKREQEPENPESPEPPKAEEPFQQNPYRQQPYQNPYNPYGQSQNQNPYGQNQNTGNQNQGSYGQGQNANSQNQSPYGQNQYPYGQNQNNYGYRNPYGSNNYGQNQNPYSQYHVPYGNNNGYGQNQNQGQNPNPNHQQPYWSYQPYNSYQPQSPQPPRKKNTGLKVFLWILGILAVGTITVFSVYAVYTSIEQKKELPETTTSQAQPDNGTSQAENDTASSEAKIEGKVSGNGTSPGSSGIVINQLPSGNPMSAKEVYKKVVESVVGIETRAANSSSEEDPETMGTGIVATADGYILTNAHVVEYSRTNKVTVILHNSKKYDATVVGYDKTSDLAVLRINANNLTPAVFGNSDQLEVGDSVVAIGNPGGMDFASSLTGGMVSAVDRSIESHSDNGMTYIQTDAAINPGNSGGPLVNMYGQVIGINSNKIVATGYEGMGFSIPITKARTVINELIAHGYVSGRSRLGITATTVTEIQSQLSGYPVGVLIREIGSESDLKKSNVVAGDIIVKADGQKITSLDDLYAVLNKHKAGDTITLTIYSPGTSQNTSGTRDVKTKLLEDKGETQK